MQLVLDYPLAGYRWRATTPIQLPVLEREWMAHTEPDMIRGRVWLTDDEAIDIKRAAAEAPNTLCATNEGNNV